jgi:hypothetical protein
VPLVSVGKLRRPVTNGIPIDQQQTSTSLEGLGATLPPPITYMFSLKLSARDESQLAFASCGDGTTTIAREVAPGKLTVIQTLKTERGARTMALDPKTHRIYLPSAKRRTFNLLSIPPEYMVLRAFRRAMSCGGSVLI